jgi:heat shock protein HtpX
VTCRICGALLKREAAARPRIQAKILRRTDFIAAQRANVRRTNQLIFILLLIAAALGYGLGWNLELFTVTAADDTPVPGVFSAWGVAGACLLLVISLAWTGYAMSHSDSLIMGMTGAREVQAHEEAQLHNVVEEMAIAAGLPKPRVFIIETEAPNAFATGMEPKSAAIGVTRGLLTQLSREELQGVIGHEMGHIVNWDIRYATAVAVLVGLIALVSDAALRSFRHGGGNRQAGGRKDAGLAILLLFLLAVIAPLIARLVQMAVSRQREFLADATSVRLTRNPEGLIGALTRLEAMARPFEGANRATQHLFIVNPIREFSERVSSLMATHPPLERRIERLRNLGND